MGFIKNNNIEIGDWGYTTKKVSSLSGYFEEGTKVEITDISYRGYDLTDEKGNSVIETGFDSVRKI